MASLFNFPWLTESLKKVTIKYLIERFLGHFFSEELDLSQFDVEIFNGKGSIQCIPLNVWTINQEISSYFPLIKFLEGFVNRIDISVPWSSLWTESCSMQLDGIKLNFTKSDSCQWNDCTSNQTSILSKSIMTTSTMEMAGEIMQQESEKYEGLEKFAQLINSLIRRVKLSATNTNIKFDLDEQNQIELRIGMIKCEEEEINLDSNGNNINVQQQKDQINLNKTTSNKDKQNNNTIILSDVITKKITVEGIELLINDILITKLYGKHTFKLRFYEGRIDMEAYFGSYIFAILNADQVKILQLLSTIINNDDSNCTKQKDQPKERLMTTQDYRRIQEMLHCETNNPATGSNLSSTPNSKFNLMSSSMISQNGGRTWTTAADSLSDEFKSFDQEHSNEKQNEIFNDKSNNDGEKLFTCQVKCPGIMLCLLSQDFNENSDDEEQIPLFNEMPMIDNLQTFIGINTFLNDILHSYSHIRLLASNLFFELKSSNAVQFSCINITAYEYHQGTLNNILWVKDSSSNQNSDHPTMVPSIRLKKIKNQITIQMAPTSIRIDPTIIERHPRLVDLILSPSSSSSSTVPCPTSGNLDHHPAASFKSSKKDLNLEDDFAINIECEQCEIELYFPVPDLRPERDDYSQLHDEVLLLDIKDIGFRIDSTTGELLFKEILSHILIDDIDRKKLFHAKSEERNLKLHFSTLVSINIEEAETFNAFDENTILNDMNSMYESVNILQSSAINQNVKNEPFQVKRNMFSEESYERIITPGDRDHIRHYLAFNRHLTKFYIYIQVPFAQIFLDDKKMFELIYNRFVNDLILWQPFFKRKSATATRSNSLANDPANIIIDNNLNDDNLDSCKQRKQSKETIFYSCRNNNQETVMDDSILSDNSYHSVLDTTNLIQIKSQNDFVLELELDHVNIQFNTINDSNERVVQHLNLQNFLLGIVSGPDSSPETVVCLNCENFNLTCEDQQILICNQHLDLSSELNLKCCGNL